MRRLSVKEIENISKSWEQTRALPQEAQDAFEEYLRVPSRIVLPLGEIWNEKIRDYIWLWYFIDLIKPEPITNQYTFSTQGLECCFGIDHCLSYAIELWQTMQSPYRINIFVKGKLNEKVFGSKQRVTKGEDPDAEPDEQYEQY